MDLPLLMDWMRRNARRVESLVDDVPLDQARWKPSPRSWSILEVVNHLHDEEREDFRTRLDIILHRPAEPWPKIDPEGWVTERRYNERDLSESLSRFLAERRASLEWLGRLGSPDWQAQVVSPFGSMRAGDMFAAWVTHDQLHLRQLVELHRGYLELLASPFSLEYAGPW